MSAFKQSMRKLGVRAGLLAGTSAAVLAIAGVGASGAAAAVPCLENSIDIQGKGASLQKEAQALLTGRKIPATLPTKAELEAEVVNAKTSGGYAAKCSPANNNTVTYTSTGSGPGLEAFGFTGAGLSLQEQTLAFIGSDDAPTGGVGGQIEAAESASGTKPVIFPVAETSIAVVMNPPGTCSFKGEKTAGITWKELNQIFAGTLSNWSELSAANGCSGAITRVVRGEGSGTTYQFKNYLSKLETEKGAVGPGCEAEIGKKTWAELREVKTGGGPNVVWPKCSGTTMLETAAGGGAVVKLVAATDGSIGYAALPDVEANKGTTASSAWLQNSEVKGVKEFAPAASGSKANCSGRSYEVPTAGRKEGANTGIAVDWSTVFGAQPSIAGGFFPLCTLTFDVGWDTYSEAKYGATAAAKGNTVKEYELNYVLQGAQQTLLGEKFYFPLPESTEAKFNVLGAAQLAAEHIN